MHAPTLTHFNTFMSEYQLSVAGEYLPGWGCRHRGFLPKHLKLIKHEKKLHIRYVSDLFKFKILIVLWFT